MSYEVKAATFNGNVVVGKGASVDAALEAAKEKAAAMGTLIRKVVGTFECVETFAEGKRAYTFKFGM